MTEQKTYSPLDGCWVILTTSKVINFFSARRDDNRFAFDPRKFVDKITIEDRVCESF